MRPLSGPFYKRPENFKCIMRIQPNPTAPRRVWLLYVRRARISSLLECTELMLNQVIYSIDSEDRSWELILPVCFREKRSASMCEGRRHAMKSRIERHTLTDDHGEIACELTV